MVHPPSIGLDAQTCIIFHNQSKLYKYIIKLQAISQNQTTHVHARNTTLLIVLKRRINLSLSFFSRHI